MNNRICVGAKCLTLCLIGLMAARTQTAIADARTISIADYTGRGFAPDLVQYALPQPVDRKSLCLTDARGQAVPIQVSRTPEGSALLGFVAQLPHDETSSWTLVSGATVAKGSVQVEQSATALVMRNDRFSVTLPPVQDKTFATPVPARTLPAPIQSWTSRGSASMGAAKILSERPVKRLRVYLAEQGDVFSDAVYELEWSEGGYYRCTVRVIHQVPLAKITEEYDLNKLDGGDFWEMDLLRGWSPDTLEADQPWGNGDPAYNGTLHPMDWPSQRKPWFPMGPDNFNVGHLGLSVAQQMKTSPATAPMAGMVMLHKGDWRRATVLQICSEKAGDLRVQLPMSARNTTWKKDLSSATSPFSMHTFDPAVPATYGKRVWGLMLAPVELPNAGTATIKFASDKYENMLPFARARSVYGVVGLDRYKDYILDWPDTGLKYPRSCHAGKTPEQLRAELAQSNLPETIKKQLTAQFCSLVTDPQQRLVARQKEYDYLTKCYGLRYLACYFTSCPTPSHHMIANAYYSAQLVDDLLAQPDLPAAIRKDLRARSALVVYLYQEPDVMNYGTGLHPGNPNMDTARFFPGVAYVPLLADHPMYDDWRKRVADYSEYKLAIQMAPGGAWFEYGTYHMHGFRIRHVLSALAAMKLPHQDLIIDYFEKDMDYYMNLLTPVDSRYRSRMIPGMADSGPRQDSAFLEAAGGMEKLDPEFASVMLDAWEENGKPSEALEDLGNVPLSMKAKQPELKSRYFPGFGVIFRAHQGPDETYMLLRNGFLWSHWYIDPGHFVMASRGALLVPFQPYQYYDSPHKDFDMYNTVRFGDPKNQMPYGWPDSNILDCYFGDGVEYAWSSTGVPDWFIKPGVSAEFKEPAPAIPNGSERLLDPAYPQKEGAFEWDRQVFFMKGATAQNLNYFVFRDTTRGASSTGSGQDGHLASYLNLNLLGRKADLAFSGGRVAANTEFPVKLDILFPDRAEVKADLLEENHGFGSEVWGAFRRWAAESNAVPCSRNWVDPVTGTPTNDAYKGREQHVFMRIASAPDQGYFWVLWPRDEKEAPPTVSMPATNVMKIVHREGVDYVFAGAASFHYAGDGIVFDGKAGTVRVRADHAELAMISGPGRVSYKQQTLAGCGPLERKVPLTGEKNTTVAASKFSIAIPATAPKGWTQQLHERGQAPVIDGNVFMEGGAAMILTKDDAVRFIASEAEYVKLTVGNVGVRGLGPFDLVLTPTGMVGTVEGRMRTLVTTWPEKLTRPMYRLDGRRWYAGWADDPTIAKGTKTPQFALAFAVTGGRQKLEVGEWIFPDQPPVPPRRALARP